MHLMINTPMDLAMFLLCIFLCLLLAVVLLFFVAALIACIWGMIKFGPAYARKLKTEAQARAASPKTEGLRVL